MHKPTNTLIGLGGYAGPPTSDGSVEIGYSIAPSYQRQGLATELTLALVDFALANPGVSRVLAHTLPGRMHRHACWKKPGSQFSPKAPTRMLVSFGMDENSVAQTALGYTSATSAIRQRK